MAFVGTLIANNNDLGYTKCHLMTKESATAILHSLDDLIGTLEVFLDKLSDARIVRVCLIAVIGYLVLCCWAADENVVDKEYHSVRNLGLQDMK